MLPLAKLFRRYYEPRPRRRPIRNTPSPTCRLAVEQLEDRIMLAVAVRHSDRFRVPVPSPANISLRDWITTEYGGTQVGRGGATINNTTAILREGTSFYVSLERDFKITAKSSVFSFDFSALPTNPNNLGVKDAFEVAFLDASGKSLVPTIGAGQDAFFNQTMSQPASLAPGVTFAGRTVTVSLAGVSVGATGTILFRLVNNDVDGDTTVTLSKVRLTTNSNARPGVIQPAFVPSNAPRTIDFSLLSDVSPTFVGQYGRTAFQEASHTLFADLSVKDIGAYLVNTPLIVAIGHISNPTVIVAGADGTTPDGMPYYDFTDFVTGTTMQPGSTTRARTISFIDPNRSAFTYDLVVLGQLNHTPRFTSQAVSEGIPGVAYAYHSTATDPDAGDVLAYSLLSGPTSLTVNAATGTVSWTPQAPDLGTHAVTLLVTDGHSGQDTQSFTITVAPAPPNRPPIFTSTPGADAGVAASFERVDIPVGDKPLGVALGDFDGSGKLSVVTANELDQTLSLAPGNGNGRFDPSTGLSVGEPPPDPTELFVMPEMLPLTFPPPNPNSSGVYGVAHGDFNGDGYLDVITTVLRDLPFNRQYWLTGMLGNGDGTFQDPVDIIQLPSVGYGILARDFDEDGILDLVVAMHDRNEVWYFHGVGDGTFDAPVALATGTHPVRLQTDDLDGDGHLDLAIYSGDSGFLSILNGDGQGSFGNLQTISTGVNGWDIAIADMDGQNGKDIVTVSHDERRIRFFTNDGAGHFAMSHLRINGSSQSIWLGDFNADGKTDIVASMDFNRIAVLHNNGDGTFGAKDLDLFGGWAGEWKGNTSYQTPNLTVDWFTDKAPIDLDADGRPDFLFGTWGRGASNIVTAGLSNGDGTFVLKQFVASPGSGVPNKTLAGTYTGAVLAGDFNNDGVQDILAGGINDFNPTRPGGVSLLLGTNPGEFASPRDYYLPRDVAADSGHLGITGMTTIGDFNEDGIPDAAILTSSLSFAPGLGDGTFGHGVAVLPRIGDYFYQQIRSADFNGDGHLDVAYLAGNGTVVVLGNGAGGFTPLQLLPWQAFPGGPNNGTTGGQNLAVGDLNGDGHADLAIRTWNYSSLSGNVEIWLYDPAANVGNGGFTYLPDAGLQMLLGRTPDDGIQHERGSNINLGDFDGDQILDIIVHVGGLAPGAFNAPPEGLPERLYWFKGKHPANPADVSDLFEAPVNQNPNPGIGLTGLLNPDGSRYYGSFWESTIGDFNHDGNLDLAGVGGFSTFVVLGNGDGTFFDARRYDFGDWDIVNADLDRDGDLDLVLNHGGFGPNAVRRGRGDGAFGPLEFISDPQGRGGSLVIHDLNGDGRLDLFESDPGNSAGAYNRYTVWLQPLPGLQAVATGDVDGDGNQDILAVNQANNHLKVMLGNGDNTFDRLHDVIVGRGPVALALGNLDGDANLDAVTANELGNTISILLGNGNGTFDRTDLPTGRKPSSVAVGDVNRDGLTDIAVTNRADNTVYLFMGQGGGAFSAPAEMPTGAQPSDVVLTDLNGDGFVDLVISNQGDNTVSVQYGDGAGSFGTAVSYFAGNGPRSVAVGDINGDGRPDLVAANPTDDGVSLLLNQGNNHFGNAIPIRTGVNPMSVELADVNGDGKPDIITADAGSDTATVLLNHFGIGAPYQYQATASDPDRDAVAFSLVSGPAGMSINSNGLVTWFPTSDQIGRNAVTLQADDGHGGTATQTFEINVTQTLGNHAPIIVSEPTTAILVDQTYSYPVHAVDGDNDPPQFSLTTAPDGMAINRQTGQLDWDPRGAALSFDGTDRAVIPDSPTLRPENLTLEGWFRFESTATAILVQKSIANVFYRASYQMWYEQSNHTLNAGVGRDDATGLIPVTASFTPELGRWYHFAFTFDDPSNAQALYIDGTQAATSVTTQTIQYTADPIVLGHHAPDYHTNYFRGTMDEIRLWDYARTQPDIQADMGKKLLGTEAGLAALYHMDEGQETKILDATPHHNDGTLGDSGAGARVPTWTSGISPLGDHAVTLRVEDGKGGFDTQDFTLTITNAAPAGISGTVFNDIAGTPGLANWVVFLDQNENGVRDANERAATSDANGFFTIDNLPAGSYRAVLEGQAGWSPTTPANGAQDIVLSPGTMQLHNFGVQTVAAGQRPPAFVGSALTNAQVGQIYVYQSAIANPDGRPVAFDLSISPDGMAVDPATGAIGWIPGTPQVGPQRVLLRVTDDRGLVALQDFTILVGGANTAPIISSTPPGPAVPSLPYEYHVQAQDAEAGVLFFTLTAATAPGMTIDSNGVVRWTPDAGDVGPTHGVVVTVTDAEGAAFAQSFNLPVVAGAANVAPVISSMPRTQIGLGNRYVYDLTVSDPDGDPLSFSLPTHPAGMTIDANGRVTWTPPNVLGPNAVTVSVSDGRGPAVTQDFTLTVVSQNPNSAPAMVSQAQTTATAGTIYAYESIALDPDGDPLLYSLDQAPPGMSIHAQTGAIRWIPTLDQLGANGVTVRVIDAQGAFATQSFTVTVRGAHVPPIITSAPPTTGSVGATYLYPLQVSAPQGAILSYSLPTKPIGMNIDAQTGLISWTPTAGDVGAAGVTVQVDDGQGGAAAQTFLIEIAANAPNLPPSVTSTPAFVATLGTPYRYTIQATDPDSGPSPLNFKLILGPAGMTVNAGSGLLEWTPVAGDIGTKTVTVGAFDGPAGTGGAGLQTFTLQVAPVNRLPQFDSVAITRVTAGNLYRYDVRASDLDGDALRYALITAPAGMTMDAQGRIRWQTDPSVIAGSPYLVSIEVRDPRGAVVTQSFAVTVSPDTLNPQVAIVLSRPRVDLGDLALVRVVAADNVRVASLTLTVNSLPVALDAQGGATLNTASAGFFALVATAADAVGNTGTASATLNVVDPSVVNAPTIAITSPADGATITTLTDIIGTVQDGTPTTYQLYLRPADAPDSAFIPFASGVGTIVNGKLGALDPTMLSNDAYVLRLIATNAGGRQSILEQNLNISGQLKLGNFQLAFEDMTIPVNGIPITVTRTYDSLDANRKGDFGFGWRLEFRNTDLRTSVPRSGAEAYGLYTPLQFGTKVYLTLPGGRREGFTFTPDQHGLFNLIYFTPRFTPDPGVTHQLTVDNVYLSFNGSEFVTLNGQIPYNPAAPEFGGGYTLRTKDGLVYTIDGNTGLLNTVADPNGNVLTFSEAGISSNAGSQVRFERDPQGRISAAIDPAGKRVAYAYSAAGDLASVTDRTGAVTQFRYNPGRAHYLSSVIDPLGRMGLRTNYDTQGRLVKTIDALGKSVQVTYDPTHSLVTTTDQLGNPTTLEYDDRGNVVQKTDALGGVTIYTYDANNNKLTETDPLGRMTSFEYDGNGNVIELTDPADYTTRIIYSAFGTPTAQIDPLGNVTSQTVDQHGNPLTFDAAGGYHAEFGYAAQGVMNTLALAGVGASQFTYQNGQPTQVTDAAGQTYNLAYDANGVFSSLSTSVSTPTGPQVARFQVASDASGRVVSITDPRGNSERYQYDTAGNLAAFIDKLGRRTNYSYDAVNRLVKTVFPDGSTEQLGYDAVGNLITRIDPSGRQTRYEYDPLGRRTAEILPDNTPTNLADNPRRLQSFNAAGEVITSTDELGRQASYAYDLAGNRTEVTDALGGVTRTTFDANHRAVTVMDALGRTTRLELDAQGDILATIFPDSTRATATYGPGGEMLTWTNAAGETTHYEYDTRLRLAAVIDPLGQRTAYAYNDQGNLASTTDANGNATRFEYDLNGKLTAEVLPTGERQTLAYDADGQVIAKTDFNGVMIRYQYDARGRVTREIRPEQTIQKTYTATGQLATVVDSRGTTQYQYDVRDRLIRKTEPDGRSLQYTYDAAGNILTITTPAGTIRYQYDALNRPSSVTDQGGGIAASQFDAVSALTRFVDPTGLVEKRTYDAMGRVTGITTTGSSGVIQDFTYSFDVVGRRTSIRELNGRRTDYQYDAAGRLVSETLTDPANGNRSTTYTYDAAGNRLLRQDSLTGATTYTYNADNRLLQETTGATTIHYSYDRNGNLLLRNGGPTDRSAFVWNSHDDLVQQTETTLAGTTVIHYAYDASGQRISRTVGTTQVRYLVDTNRPYAQVIDEYSPAGALLASHVFGPGDGRQISQTLGAARVYYHPDAVGSTMFLTNAAGAVIDQYRYNAFGQTILHQGTSTVDYLFAGEQRDPITGLDYLRARYFDPALGRFTSRDSFGGELNNPVSQHHYLYAHADPVNNRDPSGHLTLPEVLISSAIVGLISGAVTGLAFLAVKRTFAGFVEGFIKGAFIGFSLAFTFQYFVLVTAGAAAVTAGEGAVLVTTEIRFAGTGALLAGGAATNALVTALGLDVLLSAYTGIRQLMNSNNSGTIDPADLTDEQKMLLELGRSAKYGH